MPAPEGVSCTTCVYFEHINGKRVCHRYPWRDWEVGYKTNGDWCGEWAEEWPSGEDDQ